MQLHIGKTRITVQEGDIVEQNVEAIAIAANDRLWMGGKVAEAIKRKAGEDIETEAMKQGPAATGQVVITSGGEMTNLKHIFHIVIMGQDLRPTDETIRQGTRNLLTRAEELGIKSIAIPAFGTGVGKFPIEGAAKAIVDQMIDVLLEFKNLKDVRIIVHNEGVYRAFVEEFERRFSK